MALRSALARFAIVLFVLSVLVHADTAAFDLSGPRVEVKVTRAGKTLPISQVPNLQAGDRLWLHADLPAGQSVRYLLIAAFLRGSTNPPPDDWFTRAETWKKDIRDEGIYVTVPGDAQQTLLFLAPETGGDFSTLRSAVRGKPGAFVRASQDLDQASYDRSRLDAYLNGVRTAAENDPDKIKERSTLLARSLSIKLDNQCFDKPTLQQAPCLMQGTDQLVLDDGHSQSMVAALTSGPSSDLIGSLSATPLAGGGAFSPYVGAFVDVARILSNLHTAEYQYLPALALPKEYALNLKLNNPPSFKKPKSVLVVGLPAVEAAQLPPMRSTDAKQVFCLQRPSLVLPVEGAPLVFSSSLAHDFTLHIPDKSGKGIDLPAKADAARGGFVIDNHAAGFDTLDGEVTGILRGYWGFEPFDGPSFHLRIAHSAKWMIPTEDQTALIVGREAVFHPESDDAVCVDQVILKDQQDKPLKAAWKLDKANRLEVQIPLKDATAGPLTMLVKEFGRAEPEMIQLHTYAEAGRLDRFSTHSGDPAGILKGTRLDQVASLELSEVKFLPSSLKRADQKDELSLAAANPLTTAALKSGDDATAHVTLKDGRVLEVQTTVEPPRPKVILVSKSVDAGRAATVFRLGNQEELPQDGRLSFFVKTEIPAKFMRSEKIEVATTDNSSDVLLSFADGNLVLQDAQTAMAVLEPLKNFGQSAFGALQFRPVDANGTAGDWQPLASLVRIPLLKEVRCPDTPDKPCALSGTNLFLIDSVASDAEFKHNIPVPAGFIDSTLTVPRPNGTLLYIKLRDDPSVINTAVLPVLPQQ